MTRFKCTVQWCCPVIVVQVMWVEGAAVAGPAARRPPGPDVGPDLGPPIGPPMGPPMGPLHPAPSPSQPVQPMDQVLSWPTAPWITYMSQRWPDSESSEHQSHARGNHCDGMPVPCGLCSFNNWLWAYSFLSRSVCHFCQSFAGDVFINILQVTLLFSCYKFHNKERSDFF